MNCNVCGGDGKQAIPIKNDCKWMIINHSPRDGKEIKIIPRYLIEVKDGCSGCKK